MWYASCMSDSANDTTSQFVENSVDLGDQSSLRITGFVPHGEAKGIDPNLDVPAISHVEGELFQGGCIPYADLPRSFDYIVSLYPWGQWNIPSSTTRYEHTMYDAYDQDFEQVDAIADQIVTCLAKGTTLVHCQAGLNRSALCAGAALVKLGYTGPAAVGMLRKRDPLVLCNTEFEAYLLQLG